MGDGGFCLRVVFDVWWFLSTLAMVAWAAATSDCTMAFSVFAPFAVAAGAAGMSEMSSGWELPMPLMTSSSGIAPASDGDGVCDDIDADNRGAARYEIGDRQQSCMWCYLRVLAMTVSPSCILIQQDL